MAIFDKGPGVPDDLRQRVFERFYQVDASRSGDEGTGLGLAICKHIIEAHGGRVWAEGKSQGVRRSFRLHRAECRRQLRRRAADQERRGAGPRSALD